MTDAYAHNSLPSRHTTIAMTVLFALILVVPYRARGMVMLFTLPWAVGIGSYTVLAKWHRASDTLAADGIALAVASPTAAVRGVRGYQSAVALLAGIAAGCAVAVIDKTLPQQRQIELETLVDPSVFLDVSKSGVKVSRHTGDVHSQINFTHEGAAFVFFTSGSSGEPKGVITAESAAAYGSLPSVAPFPLTEGDVFLSTAPILSARTVGELLWPWFSGAAIRFLKVGLEGDPKAILREIESIGITAVVDLHC